MSAKTDITNQLTKTNFLFGYFVRFGTSWLNETFEKPVPRRPLLFQSEGVSSGWKMRSSQRLSEQLRQYFYLTIAECHPHTLCSRQTYYVYLKGD